MFERGLESEPVGGEILFGVGGGVNEFQVIIGVHRPQGGGGGVLQFFRIRRLGPSIYRSPKKKKYLDFQAPQKNI